MNLHGHLPHQQEDQVARDRQLASSLTQAATDDNVHATWRAPPPPRDEEMKDPWVSDELLEKAAALYNEDPLVTGLNTNFEDSDSDEIDAVAQPGSSAWGA